MGNLCVVKFMGAHAAWENVGGQRLHLSVAKLTLAVLKTRDNRQNPRQGEDEQPAAGSVVWERDVSGDYGVVQNFFGVGSAPLVHDDLLLVIDNGVRSAFGPKDEVLRSTVKNHQEIARAPAGAGGVT